MRSLEPAAFLTQAWNSRSAEGVPPRGIGVGERRDRRAGAVGVGCLED